MPVAVRSVSFRPTSGNGDVASGSTTCAVPNGVVAGDLLIAIPARSQTSASTTGFASSGWTQRSFFSGGTAPDRPPVGILWKAATGSEPASYTFTSTGASANDQFSVHIIALTGASTTDPFLVAPTVQDAGSATANAVAPSLSLSAAGLLMTWFGLTHYTTGASSYTTPTGMTPQVNANNDTGVWLQPATFTESRASGSTGTRTATYSATPASPPRGISFAIREGTSTPVAPTVDAGADATIATGATFTRTATETANGAAITSRAWTIVSGPAGAGTTIGTAAALSWTPSVVGTYVLRYSATNSAGTGTDDATITVADPPPASEVPALVPGQSASVPVPAGTVSINLPVPATAGNLIAFAFGGDKAMGALTMTSAGTWTKPIELGTGDSTLYLAYLVAAGGEQTITATLAVPAAGGRAWAGEYTATGGAWTVAAQATNPSTTGGPTATSWATGTTGAATGDGLAIALWGIDTAENVGTPAYSDSFTERFAEPGEAVTSRGGLWVAERSVLSGATVTSTLTRSGTVQADQMSGAVVVFARAAPNRALTSAWLGVDTVLARTSGEAGDTVRVAFSTSSAMTAPTYSASATPDSRGVSRHALPALTPATSHWYQVERGGTLLGSPRAFRTLPTAGSWSFGFGSCRDHVGDAAILSDAISRGVALFVQHGDIHYRDITTNSETAFHDAYDELHTRTQLNNLLTGTPTTYTWSDHDGPVDGGSAARPAAQAVYRARVPHPTLPSTAGIHHTFRVGRVRFVVLDTRSYASPATNTDGASKTKLGADQKTWLQNLLAAPDTPLTLIVSAEGWVGGVESGQDHWGMYQNERSQIGGWITASSTRCVMLCGDAHMLAIDDGTNSVAGVPVWHAAALARAGSVKGGPYSGGTLSGSGQYGFVEISDTGGQRVTATYRGIRSDGTVWASHTVTATATEPGRAMLAV